MKTALFAGAVLGGLLVAWLCVMAAAGWYRDPALRHLFWVAIALQACVVVVALARTRKGRSYHPQVSLGLTTTGTAAVIVFVGSLVVTSKVFPRYFDELHAAQRQSLEQAGHPTAEIDETLERVSASQTPGAQAFAGFMGTLGTGLIVSLVAAAFLRDKSVRGA
jgi:hypothetical protein